MKKFIHALALAVLLIPAVSCVPDEEKTGGTPGEDTEVLLQLRTPRGFGSTRGLSLGEERAIENVYVLEFDADAMTLKSINEALVASNESSFAVTLEPSEDGEESKLMVFANAEAILTDRKFIGAGAENRIGDPYAEVCDALYGEITNKMYISGGAIPMWGETGAIEISPDNKNNQTVNLTRSIARIDVGVGDPKNTHLTSDGSECEWTGVTGGGDDVPFRLSSVHVFRVNDRYALIPDATKLGAEEATVPDGTTKFDYDTSAKRDLFEYSGSNVTNDLYIIRQIYVPEADTKITPTGTKGDVNHTNRMAIVVGGVYDDEGNGFEDDGAPTYYRLDFAENGTLMNVLRNHLYQFNIESVTGDGEDTPVEAYENQAINMSCNVVAWSDDESNEGFDGTYHMYLSTNEMNFAGEPETQTLTLDTDYPDGWTATVSLNSDGTGTVPNDYWLTIDGGKSASGSGSATPKNISVTASLNDTKAIRTAWITVKAGDRIAIKVKVTQDRSLIPGVRAVKDVIGYIWNPGEPNHLQLTLDGDKDYFNGGPGELKSVQDEYRVYVAYFKFGSLVATSSQYDASVAFNSKDDIVAWPTEWAADRTTMEGRIGAYTGRALWIRVPVSPVVTVGATIETNLPSGHGDPCDYWFGDHDGDGATATATENWRLPTTAENITFVGKEQGFDNGTAYYNWSLTGEATETNVGIGTFPQSPGGSTSLPAAGCRYERSTVGRQGTLGYYWSSTAYDVTSGFYLLFSAGFGTYENGVYNSGYAVRCVQASPVAAAVAGGLGGTATATHIGSVTPINSAVGGSKVTFTATPDSNYAFRGWTATGITLDAAQAATNPLTVTVPLGSKGVTLTASFGIDAVRQTSDDDVIGYIYHPGYPDHYTLTLEPDNNDDTDGSITYVALFKYGSLIALSSALAPPTGGFSADDVVHWPSEWAGSRTAMEGRFPAATPAANRFLSIYTPKTAFGTGGIPAGTEFPTGEFQAFPRLAIDDACEYYFGQEYRIPSSAEWAADITSWGTYTWDYDSTNYIGTGTFGSSSVTLPAAGQRQGTDGMPKGANEFGYYWSSTSGKIINFDPDSAWVDDDASQTSANAIRCVRTPVATPVGVGEVEIPNGDGTTTVWAGSNLADMGMFAPSATDDGKFFMWGRNDGYVYNTPTGYPSNTDQGGNTTWPAVSDPCPAGGWRVPTKAEWDRLIGVMSVTTNTGDITYSSSYGSITLPAAGYIKNDTKTGTGVGATGRYWASDTPSATDAYYAGWNNTSAITTGGGTYNKIGSASVRCVRTEEN